ncbi:DUF998 domain-containing protein [Psychromicrobium lacuslunae]|uniref:DUF998 domain-containing protein n=1 Tax=Psychromicrobium lacuslunae TaxID=1618207 RepID=A0A0D4BWT8_9MICC|nr:DUF998 domain-containing protein [Psychromicrobium lacuslunae]AJT40784.1 hypothetical protein UM93_03290 [Psychromicrobium lacuslunae]
MAIIWPILASLFFAVRLVLMVALHLVPSGYHPIKHAFSDYAVGPTKRLAALASFSNTLAWCALAVAIASWPGEWSYRGAAVFQLVALAVLSVAVVFVPTDLEGEKRSIRGVIHYAVAIATFALAYSLTGDTARWSAGFAPDWLSGSLTALSWLALVGLIALCAGLVLPLLRPYFGGLERIFLFSITVFYLLLSIALTFFRT